MKTTSKYSEKLKNPNWQKKRLEILNRDDWTCQLCKDKENTLHVHHKYYERRRSPWEYPNTALITLCEDCHKAEGFEIQKAERLILKELKRLFLSDDLMVVAAGFSHLDVSHKHSSRMAEILCRLLANEEKLFQLGEEYEREFENERLDKVTQGNYE